MKYFFYKIIFNHNFSNSLKIYYYIKLIFNLFSLLMTSLQISHKKNSLSQKKTQIKMFNEVK